MRLEIDETGEGERLDRFLVARVPHMSRAKAKKLIAAGTVRINGKRCAKGALLERGDVVTLEVLPQPTEFRAIAKDDARVVVVHEDDACVVVSKPAGMPSHPLEADETGTLANVLVARYPEMASVGYSKREPGLLHRLDGGTSGLVLAARTTEAFERLRDALRAGQIDKRYLAICVGRVEAPDAITTPIARKDGKRMRVCRDAIETERYSGQPARTEILRAEYLEGERSLVEVRARSARRHQVRVHLASIGHPLVGDVLYGGPAELEHHALHAHAMRFESPAGLVDLRIEAPDNWPA